MTKKIREFTDQLAALLEATPTAEMTASRHWSEYSTGLARIQKGLCDIATALGHHAACETEAVQVLNMQHEGMRITVTVQGMQSPLPQSRFKSCSPVWINTEADNGKIT